MVDKSPSQPSTSSSTSSVPSNASPKKGSKSLALSLHNIAETLAISWPTMIEAARGRVTKEVCDARLAHWSAEIVENARIRLRIEGAENMAPGVVYLVMSNHQSLYDIPVLFHVIGPNLRMVTKIELFRVPVFGKALDAAGFIAIDRSNRERAIESLAIARRRLAQGIHVWIAPEGTRSKTGALLPFKKGGFQLALETGLPVLPVTVNGTRDVLEAKGARSVADAEVVVTVHPPLDTARYLAMDGARMPGGDGAKKGRDALMRDVRTALESAL